jgi:hypothetical protein
VRAAIGYCLKPEHLRSTIRIALVVGTILMAINQGNVIIGGNATTLTWVKTGLDYCVPFVVSNLGLLAGRRRDRESLDAANRRR